LRSIDMALDYMKAALRFLAVEYPREHDVRDVLLEVASSRTLPDEHALRPPSSIFTQADALSALKDAERVHENCKRLIGLTTHV